MTCAELRRLMDEEGAASTPEARAHLAACTDCQLLARRWEEVQGALRGMGREPAPPFLHARIMAHVRAAEEVAASPRRSFLHGWRAPAVAALGAAVVIVGLGLYSAVRPLARSEPERPSVLAQARPQPTTNEAGLEKKAAAPAAAAPAEGLKDELFALKEQEADTGRRQKGDDARAASKVAVGNAASLPAPAPAPVPVPTATAGVGGARDLEVAQAAREEQAAVPPVAAAGVLQAVAPPSPANGLVRCRLRLEGDHQELDVELPQAEAPAPDQVWLVTLHQDGRIELRDTQGEDKQAPAALQQGLTQQQARTGRYRLSQAPLR